VEHERPGEQGFCAIVVLLEQAPASRDGGGSLATAGPLGLVVEHDQCALGAVALAEADVRLGQVLSPRRDHRLLQPALQRVAAGYLEPLDGRLEVPQPELEKAQRAPYENEDSSNFEPPPMSSARSA
jgi:hypothetical protein